jgi:hypothetical protein
MPTVNSTQASASQFQLDFRLDSPLMGKAKNERTLMVYSWFALTREKQTELPLYENSQGSVPVSQAQRLWVAGRGRH